MPARGLKPICSDNATLTKTEAPSVFYSLGPYLMQRKRGLSVYRKTDRMKNADDSQADYKFEPSEEAEYWDAYRRPRPIEVLPVLLQPGDDPERIAALTHLLRCSQGHAKRMMKLLAPLSYERILREYISQFALVDEDDQIDDEEGDA